MKILMYNYEYPPIGGGGGISHHILAVELARVHDVLVVTSAFEGLPRREVMEGVEIHRVRVLGRKRRMVASLSSMLAYPPAALAHAVRELRGRSFDVINAHFAVPTGPGSLAASRLLKVPHVLTIHGGDIYDPSRKLSPHRLPVLKSTVTHVLRSSAAVVAQSRDTQNNARKFCGSGLDIRIIPLAIRIPDVPERSRSELGLPQDAFLAVTVGRLVPRKALDRLLGALARPETASVHLVVVGQGPGLKELQRLARALGIAERIRFTGWVDEIVKWQILRACDAYLSATMHEAFGLVFLEAMAMGLPVVTPDHGGHLDFLEDGVTGLIVPGDDISALAGATARLASDPELARTIGRANRDRLQEYRPELMAARYEELFERVIEQKNVTAERSR